MKKINYSIESSVFDIAPHYVRALVVALHIDNTKQSKEIKEELLKAEQKLAATFSLETLLQDERITKWRDAFTKALMNPRDHRPAHEALSRRVVQGKFLPSINTAVDIGNMYSVANLVPIGVHPLDNVKSSLVLKKAVGYELFTPFGTTEIESPSKDEIILCEEKDVYTRAWVWRQSASSITLPESKNIVINIDVLQGDMDQNREMALLVAKEISERIKKMCGGETEVYVLDREHMSVEF